MIIIMIYTLSTVMVNIFQPIQYLMNAFRINLGKLRYFTNLNSAAIEGWFPSK